MSQSVRVSCSRAGIAELSLADPRADRRAGPCVLVALACKTAGMAFGQSAGPPATHRQLHELTELIHAAGHSDFRDARGPLGLNQRQAGGRFTRDEADALIARLHAAAEADEVAALLASAAGETVSPAPDRPEPAPSRPAPTRRPQAAAATTAQLRAVPDDVLAAELQRRGWIVVEGT